MDRFPGRFPHSAPQETRLDRLNRAIRIKAFPTLRISHAVRLFRGRSDPATAPFTRDASFRLAYPSVLQIRQVASPSFFCLVASTAAAWL
jgi:hypothetical protein